MSGYLWQGSGTSSYIQESQGGAAFIIDKMLGIDQNNGSTGNGINDARAQFNSKWAPTIRALGANQCATNSGQMTCPGTSFGINWDYVPPYFCNDSPFPFTSAFDHDQYDAATYQSAPNTCNMDWSASVPEIVFYWNNGASSFHIGSQCGNVQSSSSKLPPSNNLPGGTISVTCVDPNTGLQSAHITFEDPDMATDAYVTLAGWPQSATYWSSGGGVWANVTFNLPLPPTTDAYNKQSITLHVQDTGPLAPSNSWYTWTTQTSAPCVNYSCQGPNTVPIRLDPQMSYSLTVGVQPTVGQLPPNPTIDVQSIVTPGGATYYTHGQVVATNNGGVLGNTFANVPKTNGTGMFTVNWNLYSNGGLLKSCSGQFPVINLPYLNVYGGDAMTGAAPSGGSSCVVNNLAGIYSWNQDTPGYPGAGTEYAVQALAQIEEFGSAMNPATSSPPLNLAFANSAIVPSKINPGQGLFGGFYGDSSGAWVCGTDYTKGLGTPSTGVAATNQIASIVPAGTNPAVIQKGSQLRIYASGDIYISRNIAYQNGAWPKVDQVPFFELVVVGGNIYVDSSVTQLDGVYVAEPSGGIGGQIIDCAVDIGGVGGVYRQVDPTTNGFYNTCNKQLTINGAFVAKQALFGRTNGTLGQAAASDSLSSNHDAEVFNYTPEVWLPRNGSNPTNTYDAITALPPIL
jgi:hypothetical protein